LRVRGEARDFVPSKHESVGARRSSQSAAPMHRRRKSFFFNQFESIVLSAECMAHDLR